MSRLKHGTVCVRRTNGEMGAMGRRHDGDYQADGAGTDRSTHLFGLGVRRLLRWRVAAVAHVIVSERVIIALLAAGPDAVQWAGSLVPFSTGPPTSTDKKNAFNQIAERRASDSVPWQPQWACLSVLSR